MGFDSQTHFNILLWVFLFRAFPPFRLFMIFFRLFTSYTVYREMLLLYPSSLFEHVLAVGSATPSLSFFCIDISFFLLGMCDVDTALYCVQLREADGYNTR